MRCVDRLVVRWSSIRTRGGVERRRRSERRSRRSSDKNITFALSANQSQVVKVNQGFLSSFLESLVPWTLTSSSLHQLNSTEAIFVPSLRSHLLLLISTRLPKVQRWMTMKRFADSSCTECQSSHTIPLFYPKFMNCIKLPAVWTWLQPSCWEEVIWFLPVSWKGSSIPWIPWTAAPSIDDGWKQSFTTTGFAAANNKQNYYYPYIIQCSQKVTAVAAATTRSVIMFSSD